MKKILVIILSLITFSGFCQSMDSIKHIELISEIKDSMALINKHDIDKINRTFHELKIADSLNIINDSIINNLNIQNTKLDSIVRSQKAIIENEQTIRSEIITQHSSEIDFYKKELKKSNNRKIIWQSTTGISLLTIVLIILL